MDVTQKKHRDDCGTLYETLGNSRPGRLLRQHVANTLVLNSSAQKIPVLTRITEVSRAFCTLLERPNGGHELGVMDEEGKLAPFVTLCDLFGEKLCVWSKNCTLTRELCASTYGAVDSQIGIASMQGNALRSDIDSMIELVYSLARERDAPPPSLVLVYSAPWGLGLGDRSWRLFSLRFEGGKVVDGDVMLSSLVPPPARAGSSVFGVDGIRASELQVAALLAQVRGFCIDSRADEVPAQSHSPSSVLEQTEQTRYEIATGLINRLKAELKTAREQLDLALTNNNLQVEEAKLCAIESTQTMLQQDLASLYAEVDIARTQRDDARRAHAEVATFHSIFESELESADSDVGAFLRELVHLQAEVRSRDARISLAEDEVAELKAIKTATAKRTLELERQLREARSKLDTANEAKRVELGRMADELERTKQALSEHKKTTAGTLTRLCDSQEAGTKIIERVKLERNKLVGSLEKLSVELKSERENGIMMRVSMLFWEAGTRRRARREAAHCAAHRFAIVLARARARAMATEAAAVKEEEPKLATTGVQTDSVEFQSVRYNADAVSTANACVSVLRRFVEVSQAGPEPVAAPPPVCTAQAPVPAPAQVQPVQEQYVDYSNNGFGTNGHYGWNYQQPFYDNSYYQHPQYTVHQMNAMPPPVHPPRSFQPRRVLQRRSRHQ
jgi:hypothetical protein